jgi:hypothetical protein
VEILADFIDNAYIIAERTRVVTGQSGWFFGRQVAAMRVSTAVTGERGHTESREACQLCVMRTRLSLDNNTALF